MIIFLFGKDTYRLHRKLNEIKEGYNKKVGQPNLNFEQFDALEIGFKEFWDRIFQGSIFTDRKLVYIKNLLAGNGFRKNFIKKIKEIAESKMVVVISEGGSTKETNKDFAIIKKFSRCQEFKPLGKRARVIWAENEFKRNGIRADRFVLEKLIESVGDDMWRLSNEIEKLSCFLGGQKNESAKAKTITLENIKLLIREKIDSDIFKTIDAVSKKEKSRALSLLKNHLDIGDNPSYLISMMAFQFRRMLMLKSEFSQKRSLGQSAVYQLSRKFNVHPYAIWKTLEVSRNFSMEDLKRIYQKLFLAEKNIKTNSIEPATAIELFISEI